MLRGVYPERSERAQHDSERAVSRTSWRRPLAFNGPIGSASRRRPDITDSRFRLCMLRMTVLKGFSAASIARRYSHCPCRLRGRKVISQRMFLQHFCCPYSRCAGGDRHGNRSGPDKVQEHFDGLNSIFLLSKDGFFLPRV